MIRMLVTARWIVSVWMSVVGVAPGGWVMIGGMDVGVAHRIRDFPLGSLVLLDRHYQYLRDCEYLAVVDRVSLWHDEQTPRRSNRTPKRAPSGNTRRNPRASRLLQR